MWSIVLRHFFRPEISVPRYFGDPANYVNNINLLSYTTSILNQDVNSALLTFPSKNLLPIHFNLTTLSTKALFGNLALLGLGKSQLRRSNSAQIGCAVAVYHWSIISCKTKDALHWLFVEKQITQHFSLTTIHYMLMHQNVPENKKHLKRAMILHHYLCNLTTPSWNPSKNQEWMKSWWEALRCFKMMYFSSWDHNE